MGQLQRNQLSLVLSKPVEQTFSLLTSGQDLGLWWSGSASSFVQGKSWEKGAKIQISTSLSTRLLGFRKFFWVSEVLEVQENRLIELYYVDGDFRGAESWEFEPVGQGTRISHTWRGVEPKTIFARGLTQLFGTKLHTMLYQPALEGISIVL